MTHLAHRHADVALWCACVYVCVCVWCVCVCVCVRECVWCVCHSVCVCVTIVFSLVFRVHEEGRSQSNPTIQSKHRAR